MTRFFRRHILEASLFRWRLYVFLCWKFIFATEANGKVLKGLAGRPLLLFRPLEVESKYADPTKDGLDFTSPSLIFGSASSSITELGVKTSNTVGI